MSLKFPAWLWSGVGLATILAVFLGGVGLSADTLPYPPQGSYSDSTISRYPDALHFRRSLIEDHSFPLWNAHLMGGQPFAANPGSKVFYPLTWLLLILTPTLHLNLMALFHLWWGGMGMGLWSRRTGLTPWPSFLAALGYSIAPKLVGHAGVGHLDLLMGMAWLPWCLVAIHHLAMPDEEKAQRQLPVEVIGLAFSGAMLLIGAIQLLLYTYGLGIIYAAYCLWYAPKKRRLLLAYCLAALLTIGFSAVQWMPLWELRDSLSRGDIRAEDAGLLSIEPSQLVGLLIGDHGGSQETLTYIGLSSLLLALLGLLMRPKENRLWWGIILLAGLYSLGDHFLLWRGITNLIPPLLWFRVPSRAWFLMSFLIPYLAAWGLQTLVTTPPDGRWVRLGIVGLIGLGLTCGVSSLVILQETEIKPEALWGIFFLPLTAFLIALVIFGRLPRRYTMPLFCLLILVDGVWIDRSLIEGRSQSEWLNPTPPSLIADLARTGGRIYTPDYAIPQQDTAYWGIARFDGVDPFQMNNFIEAADDAVGVPREGYSTTVPAIVVLPEDENAQTYRDAPMNPKKLGAWGVEWVITRYPITIEGLSLADQLDGLYFYHNEEAWGDTIQLDWDGPNRVQQTILENDLWQIRTVTKVEGWQTAEGGSAGRDFLSLPPLNQTYAYRPQGVWMGLGISLMSYVLAGAWWFVGKVRHAA